VIVTPSTSLISVSIAPVPVSSTWRVPSKFAMRSRPSGRKFRLFGSPPA